LSELSSLQVLHSLASPANVRLVRKGRFEKNALACLFSVTNKKVLYN
jgi:hypothetical protein